MKIVEMQPNIMHVNQAEKCSISKDMDTMADYTMQQHIAATVELSPEGSKKASSYLDIKDLKQEQIELSSGETVTERPFDTLLDAVLNGETLSEDEQERLDNEMFQKILAHYDSMSNLRLSSEDERILEALKKNFHMKQQALQDMKEAKEREKLEEQTAQQEANDTKNAGEAAEKISEIEMLNKTLENMDANQEEAIHENTDKKQTTDTVNDETAAESDNEKNVSLNKDIQNEERNKNNIQELDSQRIEEAKQEREYRKMLDDCFAMAKQPFVEDGHTLKERAEIYLDFKEKAEELAINREIARHQKIYDYESVSELKIKALSSTSGKSFKSAIRSNTSIQNAGQQFVRNAVAEKIKATRH